LHFGSAITASGGTMTKISMDGLGNDDGRYMRMDIEDLTEKILNLTVKASKSANDFYWIAGLALLNTVILITGGMGIFVFDLGVNLLIYRLANSIIHHPLTLDGYVLLFACFALQIAFACSFILIGNSAKAFSRKYMLAGMVLYCIDGVVLFFLYGLFAEIVHVWFIYSILRGYLAMTEYEKLKTSLLEDTSGNYSLLIESKYIRTPEKLWKFGIGKKPMWRWILYILFLLYMIRSAYP
jgi:hypothetical protein